MNPAFTIRPATETDSPAIAALVRSAKLPVDGIEHARFTVADHAGRIVGCAGLEVYGGSGLLRSVAVDPEWRGRGVGDALVRAVLDGAAQDKVDPVVLLTDTAPAWFPRFGFEVTTRENVPSALHASAEFKGACPDTATVMRIR